MWSTVTTDEFDTWFAALIEDDQVEVSAAIGLLRILGPQLRRPHADTLTGSRYANMKELRVRTARAAIRIAFAFDPARKAVLLIGGNKAGVSERRFYRQLIDRADALYAEHLRKIAEVETQKGKGS